MLVYKGRKLAALEAKKESLSYSEGVRQAKDYAERLQCRIAYARNAMLILVFVNQSLALNMALVHVLVQLLNALIAVTCRVSAKGMKKS